MVSPKSNDCGNYGIKRIDVFVTGHEVRNRGEKPFACYKVEVTTESYKRYTLTKRWNDLRVCDEALRKANGALCSRLPKFEYHSWRLGDANFDEAFLSERESSMQQVLQAWVAAFAVGIDAAEGPEPLLAFLSAEDAEPGRWESAGGVREPGW